MDKESIKSEAETFMKLVHVDEYADRMPDRLSGGQQQRVALARALVIKPDVLLMDEPLSNLDAKLRVEMRGAIKELQHEVGITTVYVTHDQEEAMAISDRIAVMKDGEIHQCASPVTIYQRPADLFVATFIGKSNIVSGRLVKKDNECVVHLTPEYAVAVSDVDTNKIKQEEQKVALSIRPEEFILEKDDGTHSMGLKGVIKDSIFLGLNTHYLVQLENGDTIEVIQESKIGSFIPPNSKAVITVDATKINLFDVESEKSLMMGVVHDLMGDQHVSA